MALAFLAGICTEYSVVTFKLEGFTGAIGDIRKLGPRVEKGARRVIRRSAEKLVRDIKAEVPVDTGALKDSISARVSRDGLSAVVSTNDEAARLVEFGGRRQDPRPYFLPTAAKAAPAIRRAIEASIMKAVK